MLKGKDIGMIQRPVDMHTKSLMVHQKGDWIRLDHELTQILTKHENFRAKKKGLNFVNDDRYIHCLVSEIL